jgi:hypothetical protein
MKRSAWFLIYIIFFSCKDKYTPKVNYPVTGFLVVEGFINTGNDSTFIILSRTSGLDSIQIFSESGAQVEVQSAQGASYPLAEQSGGKYGTNKIPVDPAQQYRIHIKTTNGKEYLSDFSAVRVTPPIDSVNFKAGTDLVTIYVSTHDDQNKSIYYQWSFDETWQYNSKYISNYVFDPLAPNADTNGFAPRLDAGLYYTCWLNSQSANINLGSTASLRADVVSQFPLQTISYYSSNRLVTRYSMLVKQNVLSKDAYEWKEKLKKNTEELGSIFDAQPSETTGNIHNTADPTEQVIGFVECSSQTTKRIFINRYDLPNVFVHTGYEDCSLDSVALTKDALALAFAADAEWPVDYIARGFAKVGITASYIGCIDCRTKGGVNVKPSFW